MKILMILSRCDQTGMTTHTLDLSSALVGLGHDVTLLVGYQKGEKESFADKQVYKLYSHFMKSGVKLQLFREPSNGSIVNKLLSTIQALWYIATHRFDAIHVQSPYLSFLPWLLGRRFTSTTHTPNLVRCFYYKNATHLIAISRETRDDAKRIFGYRDDQITIVNHGVSPRFATLLTAEERVAARARLGLPTDKIIVGLVGSIEKRKGHDLLLRAVADLPEELRAQVHVCLLGSSKNGKTVDWLNGVIEQTDTAALISRYDYQDPELFYKVMDIFCLPSRFEGYALVVVEAMLSGCCCVRSDTQGASEQIESGVDGFIFESEHAEQLSAQLAGLIADPALLHRVAEAGRQKALRLFTSEVMARNTLEVYKKIMD